MAMRYIKVYYDWLDAIQPLSDGERGRLLTALLEYARNEELITLNGGERYVFPSFKAQIDRDRQSYEDISQKRSAVGAMGGRPKADEKAKESKKSNCFFEKAKESKKSNCFQDKDKDKDKDQDQDQEKDQDQERGGCTLPHVVCSDNGVKNTHSRSNDRFERFWQAYPRKMAKDAARVAFDKRKPDDAMLETMLQAIDAQKKSEQWLHDGGRFIPHPATWLNQGRWQDEATASGVPRVKTVSAAAYEQREYTKDELNADEAAFLEEARKAREAHG